MPEILRTNGIYSHLVSDHYHYWEDGGATYHNRFSSWEMIRGQEGDSWKGHVKPEVLPEYVGFLNHQDWVNRKYMSTEATASQTLTFDRAEEFLQTNHQEDNWFLQVECFDPHPPFFAPEKYRNLYPENYDGPHFDWPHYDRVQKEETPEMVKHCRNQYAALVSMCDHSLGRIMDFMDSHDLWKDTLLIVTTDHGFLLGEHGWWAFCNPPFWDEVSVKPLFVWDPRCQRQGERSQTMVQTHDIPATLLEYFNLPLPADMQGIPLRDTIASDKKIREAGLFGIFGGHVNCSDGRYVYMKAPVHADNSPLYNYTLMATHMKKRFSVEELQTASLAAPFSFTKGVPTLKVKAKPIMSKAYEFGDLLFDLDTDPNQQKPLHDPVIEQRMRNLLIELMRAADAPTEQFERLGLPTAAG